MDSSDADFGRTARDYARHRPGFPPRLFRELSERGMGGGDQRVLDLGTGTGLFARGLAGLGCTVTGLDISAELLRESDRMNARAGLTIRNLRARAEETEQEDCSYEWVSAGHDVPTETTARSSLSPLHEREAPLEAGARICRERTESGISFRSITLAAL